MSVGGGSSCQVCLSLSEAEAHKVPPGKSEVVELVALVRDMMLVRI